MADTTSHIISYQADIQDVKSSLRELERINAELSKKLGKDFANASNILRQSVDNVKVKNIIDPKTGAETLNVVGKLSTVFQTADGSIKTFTERVKILEDGFQPLDQTLKTNVSSIKAMTASLNPLEGKFSNLNTNFSNFRDINSKFANELGKVGNVTSFVGTTLERVSNAGSVTSKVFETTSGKFVKLTETTKNLPNGIRSVSRSIDELNAVQKANLVTLEKGALNARTFGDNITTLAKRALLTIPIWLALRGAILGVFNVFTDGFKNLVAFDLALQKIKRNLSGTPEEIQRSMENIRTEITATSLALGVSTEKIAEAVKKFASLGFSVEESLAGAIGASKLSVVLFGDAGETADAFARSLNLLIDRSKGAGSATEQMNQFFAQTAELEKTNQFEIKEVNESLKNSAGTFKSLGVNGQQALSLLASLGTNLLEGARGGTLISSALQQMISNLDKVSSVLGISVNPQTESTIVIFDKIVTAIEALGKTDLSAQTKAINEIFGGVKGAKTVRAIISDLERFKKNMQITGDINTFNKAVSDVTDTLSKQVDTFHNLNKEIGKAFITGLVGGQDFKESLKIINETLQANIKESKEWGQALSAVLRGGIVAGLPILLDDIKKKTADAKSELLALANQGLQGKLDTKTLTDILNQLTIGVEKGTLEVAPQLLTQLRQQLQDQVNDSLKKKEIDIEAKANATVAFNDISLLTTKEEQEIRKLIVQNQLEQSKLQGATTSEILKQESSLNKQLGIYEDEFSILTRQLETQRAINEEKRLQNRLGSDSVKLFEIAQTSGTDVAKQIGEVLAGNIDFSSFIRRGGQAVEIFKQQFDDVFKNQQAQQFFRGERVAGLENLRGGSNIAIQEEQIRRAISSFSPTAQTALNRAENQIPTIRNDIQARIEMNINVQGLSFREAVARMKEEMSKEILNPQSDLGKALDERIEKF